MVRKLLLVSFLLLSVLSLASVYAAPVYEGDLFNGDNFTIGNDSYKIAAYGDDNYWMNYSTVVFKKFGIETELFTAKYAQCAYTEYYEYCYDYTYYDFDKKKTYESTRIEPLMHIRVEYLTPLITITRPTAIELDHSKLYQLTTILKNTGNNEVIVDYIEELPIGLFASDCVGCIITDNLIKKKVNLKEGEESTFTNNIVTYNYDVKNWNASYTYTVDTGIKRSNIAYTATVNTPFEFKESLSKNSADNLEDYSVYTLSITDLDKYKDMDAKIVIDTGDAIILESVGLENDNNKYFYDGRIYAGHTEVFTVKISSKMIGTFPIITNVTLSINDRKLYSNTKNIFTVNSTGLTPSISINRVKLVPGDNISLLMKLNNDAADAYYNIFSKITGLSEDYVHRVSLSPGHEVASYNTTYIVPELPNETVIMFTFSGTYNTENNQELRFYTEKKLTVESSIPAVIINTTNVSNVNTTQNITNITNIISTNTANTTPTDTTSTANKTIVSLQDQSESTTEEEKTDLLSRFFNSINKFMEKIFGKKK